LGASGAGGGAGAGAGAAGGAGAGAGAAGGVGGGAAGLLLALGAAFFRLMYLRRRFRFSALLYCLLIRLYFINALRLFSAL